MKRLDLTGQRFNKLIVINKEKTENGRIFWNCLCDCGNNIVVITGNLKSNRVKSCGCLKVQKLIERSTIHNQRHSKLYEVWKSIKQRCFNPNNSSYKNYGGRGITMCDEWKNDFTSFLNWSINNGYSIGLTIDRVNNDWNYCPNNCRWVDRRIQANNTRCNKLITINNKTDTLANWIRFYKISYSSYYKRIKKGLSEQEALTNNLTI